MDARVVASRRKAGAVTKGDGRNADGTMAWPIKRDRSRRAAFASLWLLSLACPARAADMPLKAPSKGACDPYKNYSCLDAYLGEDFWTRLINYYRLEWGKEGPPSDPKAPPSRRDSAGAGIPWPGCNRRTSDDATRSPRQPA